MNFAKSRQIDFQMPDLPGSMNLGHGNAAGLGGFVGMYGNNLKTAPRYDQLAATNVAVRSNERAAVTKTEADVHSMGLQDVAAVKSAKFKLRLLKLLKQKQTDQ